MQLVSVSYAFLSNQSVPIDSFISVAAKLGVHFNDSFSHRKKYCTSLRVMCLVKENLIMKTRKRNIKKKVRSTWLDLNLRPWDHEACALLLGYSH